MMAAGCGKTEHGGGDAGTPGVCASVDVSGVFLENSVVFVVDRSASMAAAVTEDHTRASSVVEALWQVRDYYWYVGVVPFPGPDGCFGRTDVLQLTDASLLEEAALREALQPAGTGLPLVEALRSAYAELETAPEPTHPDDTSVKLIYVITDGGEPELTGCSSQPSSEKLFDEARAAVDSGIQLRVIGLPGSEADRELLSELAAIDDCTESSSVPESCHYDLSEGPWRADANCLQCTLRSVLTAPFPEVLRTCEVRLEIDGPVDRASGNVELTLRGGSVRVLEQGEYEWVDDTAIRVLGDACDALRDTRRFVASFACTEE
jgi:hypothetical protein